MSMTTCWMWFLSLRIFFLFAVFNMAHSAGWLLHLVFSKRNSILPKLKLNWTYWYVFPILRDFKHNFFYYMWFSFYTLTLEANFFIKYNSMLQQRHRKKSVLQEPQINTTGENKWPKYFDIFIWFVTSFNKMSSLDNLIWG